MSHELRTPLNSIAGFSGNSSATIRMRTLSQTSRVCPHYSRRRTDLLNLITDILDLSKIESGTVSVEAEEVFFASLLDAVGRPFRHEAENRRLSFEVTKRSASRAQRGYGLKAAAAGVKEFALERLQVHRSRRRADAVSLLERLERGSSDSWKGRIRCGLRSVGYRHRHSIRKATHHI